MSGTLSQNGSGSWVVSSDPLVAFDSQATFNTLKSVVEAFDLEQGRISERGESDNPDINRLDLQISQELPALPIAGHRTLLTFDIGNVLNLINDEWGVIKEYGDSVNLYSAACADANGVASNAGAVTCNTYRISSATSMGNAFTTQRNTDLSRWTIQIGLRYEF